MRSRSKLGYGGAGTGAGTLMYTVPQGYSTEIIDINIANTTSGTLSCSIHFVASGGSVATTNALFYQVPILAYSVEHWTGMQTLREGDFIQAVGSGAGLTLFINGIEGRNSA